MPDVKLFKSSTVRSLFDSVEENLEKYRSGDFSDLLHDSNLFLGAACDFSAEQSVGLTCTPTDDNEVACCLAIFNALPAISASLARDDRLWVRLSHIEFCEYARTRWKIPANSTAAVAHIRRHFFARGTRGVERDNAISRLWWMTEISKRVEGLSIEDSLKTLLFKADVRANKVEVADEIQERLEDDVLTEGAGVASNHRAVAAGVLPAEGSGEAHGGGHSGGPHFSQHAGGAVG